MAEANKVEFQCSNVVQGYLFPPFTTNEWLEQAKIEFKSRDTDVFIISFPKSGTHWLGYTVHFLICKEKITKPFLPNYINFFDLPQVDALPETMEGFDIGKMRALRSAIDNFPDPRIFMSHFLYEHLPQNPKAKYLYIYRNPKDIIVSAFNHLSNSTYKPYQGTFDQFFDLFIETDFFKFCKHFKGFLEHKDEPNYFIISYEELKQDFKTKVQEIAVFLGIELTEELYALIEKETNFETMKGNVFINYEHIMQKGTSFLPNGRVGTWKKKLSKEQSDKVDQILLSGLGEEMVKKYFIFS